jgi:hypothetical protein
VGKSRPGIVYFSTEPETFRPISDVSTVHLVHFYPERDGSRKISIRYRLFFNGNGKKIANFCPWAVLPGKIRSHSGQVRWRFTEQIPFTYRHFLKLSRWNSVKAILERDRCVCFRRARYGPNGESFSCIVAFVIVNKFTQDVSIAYSEILNH